MFQVQKQRIPMAGLVQKLQQMALQSGYHKIIANSSKYNQIIYKMKWNYDYTWHQYATDELGYGISGIMENLIGLYGGGSSLF